MIPRTAAIAGRRPIPHLSQALLFHEMRRRLPGVCVSGSTATAACTSSPRDAISEMGEFSAGDAKIFADCVEGGSEGSGVCSRVSDEFPDGCSKGEAGDDERPGCG